MNNLDILVRGAGAVGLTAALALSRLGLRVAVQDLQAGAASTGQAAPQQDVRAYALNAASVRLLADLKVWEAIPGDARTAVHDMHIEGDVPGASLDFSAWSQGLAELAWIVDAAELETALRTAARFAPHLVTLPHGTAAEPTAALQVLAEGKASDSRARLGVGVRRHDYGHRALAARLRCDRPHAGLARQWFRSPDVLALLPLDRPQPGHGFGLVWSLPEERAAELLGLSAADFEAALNDATGAAAGTLCLASERVGWPLSLQQAQAVHGPGWVLVGDAAHVVHPLAGQGLNLGLADVAALAQVLAERARQEPWRALGDPRLLARYARARAAPTRAMALVTDGLLQLFAHPQPLVRELRNRGMGLVNQVPAFKRLLIRQALGN